MPLKRYLHQEILADLKEKMVFIGGPRQVGKTTLANLIGAQDYADKLTYLNWDSREDRRAILHGRYQAASKLVIFDEIHKFKKWKNHLKGEYDKNKQRFHILVTGSARLDIYRRGGDSLMGRYHYFRLHPFSVAEAASIKAKPQALKELNLSAKNSKIQQVFGDLFTYGGFPEPFIKKDTRTLRRFHNERLERLVKEDIRDIESLRDLSALQVLVELLPAKVGSLLSINALREDLEVAHKTVSLWMDILERFFYHFRIYPYTARQIRSLKKEPKLYLWDWSQLEGEPQRLENMVASHLLKLVHYLYDAQGHKAELYFLRDTDGREVDFLVTIDRRPWLAVEVKTADLTPAKHLSYFKDKLNIPFAYQVVRQANVDLWQQQIRIISADKFLSGLV